MIFHAAVHLTFLVIFCTFITTFSFPILLLVRNLTMQSKYIPGPKYELGTAHSNWDIHSQKQFSCSEKWHPKLLAFVFFTPYSYSPSLTGLKIL